MDTPISCVARCLFLCSGEGGGKERSAETGQEGLEDVPDYQESLRKYALGLGEQEENSGKNEESTASNVANSKKPGDPKSSNKVEKANPSQYHGPPPPPHFPHGVPNGYPYPMPHYHPGLPHRLPAEGERTNGAGFPPDGYYPHPPPGRFRMPAYPPHPSMLKQGMQTKCMFL